VLKQNVKSNGECTKAFQASVLIVDDDEFLRTTLKFSLEMEGFQVAEAGNASAAIAFLQTHQTEVILLDMGMPPHKHSSEEGLRVLDFVHQQQLPCKVVVLTGQNAENVAYLAVKHGAFDYLQKPVDEKVLIQAIYRAKLFYEQSQQLAEQEKTHQVQILVPMGEGVKQVRNQAEEKIVRKVLQQTGFNVHETARQLGLKRENVYYLIKKYQIQRPSPLEEG